MKSPRTHPFHRKAAALLALLLVSGSVSSGVAQETPKGAPEKPSTVKVQATYRLQPGDEISLSVLPQKEYDTTASVLPDGQLNLKNLKDPINAAGMTIDQLRSHIKKLLDEDLVDPMVTVTITKLADPPVPSRPKVTVIGGVVRPGLLELEEGLRLMKAIDLAGGTLKEADLTKVAITHKDLKKTLLDLTQPNAAANLALNVELKDGDSIEVPVIVIRTATVVGSVIKPGTIPVEEGLRVRKAIELAGGNTLDADLTKVLLRHKDLSQRVLDLSTPDKVLDPMTNVLVLDGDSIEIGPVFRAGVVTIQGAVTAPGNYDAKPGLDLNTLIKDAGKLNLLANPKEIQLFRKGDEKPQIINLLDDKYNNAPPVVINVGDRVFVPQHKTKILLGGSIADAGPRPVVPGTKIRDFFYGNENVGLYGALNDRDIDLTKLEIVREGEDRAIKVNLKKVRGDAKRPDNIALQDGDQIVLSARIIQNKPPLGGFGPLAGVLGILFNGVGF